MADDEQEKIKLLFLGPVKCGKSTLASFLSGTRDTATSKYYPTEPLRILETELELDATKLKLNEDNQNNKHKRLVFAGGDARKRKVIVQLWDVSGNVKHQQGWPAIADHADGIIYVFNHSQTRANVNANSQKELSLWYKHFALNQNEVDENGNFEKRVLERHSLIFAHQSAPADLDDDEDERPPLPTMPKEFRKSKVIKTSLDYESDNFKEVFDSTFVERIVLDKMEERRMR
ncbi:Rab family, other [Angomonas deanei]|nr:Rab family, other [Angomonas deanei]|eukprot:EPY37612.1 Rab family, other [Angomonas deanei]